MIARFVNYARLSLELEIPAVRDMRIARVAAARRESSMYLGIAADVNEPIERTQTMPPLYVPSCVVGIRCARTASLRPFLPSRSFPACALLPVLSPRRDLLTRRTRTYVRA